MTKKQLINLRKDLYEAYLKLSSELINSENIFHDNNPETELTSDDYEDAMRRLLEIEDYSELLLKQINAIIPVIERRRYRRIYYRRTSKGGIKK